MSKPEGGTSRGARFFDDIINLTLLAAIQSPRTGTSEFTFPAFDQPSDPKEAPTRLFWLEREGDTVRITCTKTGKRTEVAWSQVREARRPPISLEEIKLRLELEAEAKKASAA